MKQLSRSNRPMKQYQRFIIMLAVLTIGLVGTVNAQQFGVQPVWANYAVQYRNLTTPYSPLAGGTVLPGIPNGGTVPINFVNFTGAIDMDDGTAVGVPTGFSFDYNGNQCNSVNININGWVSINMQDQPFNPIPVTPANNNVLFSSVLPNNCIAPFFGDHYYRTTEPGYFPSKISYAIATRPDPNTNSIHYPFDQLYTFTVEWSDLNINDKTNPNSVGSFQLIIRENPLANDKSAPDDRATFEFQYGPVGPPSGSASNVVTSGAAVGANDSVGFTHINALFATASDPNDVANNTSARTTCWPPVVGCTPGLALQLVPVGRDFLATWGDGDADLSQVTSTNPQVRNNQSLFVTINDANVVLQAAASGIPLDSIEGSNAFHGDANHTGQVYNPNYGAYFYHTTPYDAAYIMMYLAGKLATLPWPSSLPVPGYKSSEVHATDVSGVVADVSNVNITGNTISLPITIRGSVNGPLSIQMDLKGLEQSGVQLIGTRALDGAIMCSDAKLGRVALATSGDFADGATVGYIELRAPANTNAEFDVENVQVNDANLSSSHVALKLADNTSGSQSDLEQNVPNPFVVSVSGQTTIGFDLTASENVTLRIFDVLGHEVQTLISDEGRTAGHNTVQWDGRDVNGSLVASGLYYYQLTTPDFTQCAKMQVVR